MPFSLILDTSVLFPMVLRDILLRCAEQKLFNPLWSDRIIEELRRNLIRDARLSPRSTDRLIEFMIDAFPTASISGYEYLIPAMTNHPNDRHVLAAAVHAGSSLIATSNLRHFPFEALEPHSISAQSPDELLSHVATEHSPILDDVIRQLADDYDRPPLSISEILAGLERSAPNFASQMRVRILADEL